ncbi:MULTISPECIES: hypothetical protein [unclassified Roseivivax]|uniref:hypothetical protein n=1 Tax=unclassified Roseivivax TaxID=2639302 RepID=UPI001268C683|nr:MULTISPECIES: hypothetical protein [unclassified Roseivivax]
MDVSLFVFRVCSLISDKAVTLPDCAGGAPALSPAEGRRKSHGFAACRARPAAIPGIPDCSESRISLAKVGSDPRIPPAVGAPLNLERFLPVAAGLFLVSGLLFLVYRQAILLYRTAIIDQFGTQRQQ